MGGQTWAGKKQNLMLASYSQQMQNLNQNEPSKTVNLTAKVDQI
ncbi:hypothetical protein [uncultured Campylobacter sp.]|nr:hypothetical protein [uncultured Campylobacter sp.]